MYCFLGLLKPTAGKVEAMGATPHLGSRLYTKVAYLPEEPHYHLYLTVEEATRYYASLYGKRVSAREFLTTSSNEWGLAQFKSLPLSKCSKGMKQKVGIAQCLIHETQLLFLDEPTRGLDPLPVREFRETLREIHQRGATIVMNTHVLSEIEMLANRVAVIEGGKVIAQDDLHNFLTLDPANFTVWLLNPTATCPLIRTAVERLGGLVKGNVPKAKLYEFMQYTQAANLTVHECSLKKNSLEDSFFKLVKGNSEENESAAAK